MKEIFSTLSKFKLSRKLRGNSISICDYFKVRNFCHEWAFVFVRPSRQKGLLRHSLKLHVSALLSHPQTVKGCIKKLYNSVGNFIKN
jgi:hypothetical protein